jgi:hypothetical protein
MTRSCKMFWYPWVGVMLAAGIMLSVGAFPAARAQPASAPLSLVVKTTSTSTDSRELAPTTVTAPATVTSAPSLPASLIDMLLKLVGIAATTIITVLLRRWLSTKVNTEVLGQVTELASQGVALAEEIGHQRVKAGQSIMSPTEKSDLATTYVTETASKLGLSLVAAITPVALKSMTDAQVSASRPPVAP